MGFGQFLLFSKVSIFIQVWKSLRQICFPNLLLTFKPIFSFGQHLCPVVSVLRDSANDPWKSQRVYYGLLPHEGEPSQ